MCNSCISIYILPEFGWTIQNKTVFGPGSVLQGFVTINNSNVNGHNILMQAEKIKITFSSTEAIQAYTISPGIVRSCKKSIFAVQKIIWDSKSLDITPIKSEYKFSFTVQLPMVQFPPSIDHCIYQTAYKISAIVELTENINTASILHSEIPITYMPLVETRLLKSPIVINTTSEDNKLTASIKLATQDYVPGDYIDIELTLLTANQNIKKDIKQNSKSATVIVELHQTLKTLVFDDVPDQVTVVESRSQRLSMELNNDAVSPLSYNCVANIGLFVPTDLPPSFQGRLTSISYALHMRVEQRGTLGGIWKRTSRIKTIPITIGTLGYGIHSSFLLKNYSDWGSTGLSAAATTREECGEMPLPKFMRNIEYEEAPPLYEVSSLPPYCEEEAINSPSTTGA